MLLDPAEIAARITEATQDIQNPTGGTAFGPLTAEEFQDFLTDAILSGDIQPGDPNYAEARAAAEAEQGENFFQFLADFDSGVTNTEALDRSNDIPTTLLLNDISALSAPVSVTG